MKKLLILISIIGLLLSIIPAFLVFSEVIHLETNKLLMMIGTLIWFISAPFWMNKKREEA